MERIKNTNPEQLNDGKIYWKKIGGGSLRLFGKIIKSGETFRAGKDAIPKAFRDVVIPLEDIPETNVPEQILDITKSAYKLQKRGKSELWWDVVDSEGKTINEKAMKREIAEKLISDLSK